MAARLGYFGDEGLDVELLTEPSGVHAEDELLAGAEQGVVGFYDHTIDLQAKGKLVLSVVLSVVQSGQAPGEVELVATRLAGKVRDLAALKGLRLGVTGLGSSTDFLSRYLLISQGLRPDDATLLAVGAGDTFVQALAQQTIAAGMTSEPTASRLLKSGAARSLVDLRTPEQARAALGGLYPAACLYMGSAWVGDHPHPAQLCAAQPRQRRTRRVAGGDAPHRSASDSAGAPDVDAVGCAGPGLDCDALPGRVERGGATGAGGPGRPSPTGS